MPARVAVCALRRCDAPPDPIQPRLVIEEINFPEVKAAIAKLKSNEDFQAYQDTVNEAKKQAIRYQSGETECTSCAQAKAVLTTLMQQVDIAMNLYIAYVIFTILFLNVPVAIYDNSNWSKYKHLLLVDKIRFMILVVILIYVIKYIEFVLLAPIAIFIYDVNIDPCYIDASFLGAMGQAVISTCAEVQSLSLTYYEAQSRIRTQYLASETWMLAKSYSATITRFAGLPDNILFEQFYQKAKDRYVGSCNNTDYLQQALNSPGSDTEASNGIYLLLEAGIIAQLLAKLILSRFGYAMAYLCDPLAFHEGHGEVATGDSAPPAVEIIKFLKAGAFPTFVTMSILCVMCLMNLAYSAASGIDKMRKEGIKADAASLAWLVITIMVCMLLLMAMIAKYFWSRYKNGYFNLELYEVDMSTRKPVKDSGKNYLGYEKRLNQKRRQKRQRKRGLPKIEHELSDETCEYYSGNGFCKNKAIKGKEYCPNHSCEKCIEPCASSDPRCGDCVDMCDYYSPDSYKHCKNPTKGSKSYCTTHLCPTCGSWKQSGETECQACTGGSVGKYTVGPMSRAEAEEELTAAGMDDGAFLIRESGGYQILTCTDGVTFVHNKIEGDQNAILVNGAEASVTGMSVAALVQGWLLDAEASLKDLRASIRDFDNRVIQNVSTTVVISQMSRAEAEEYLKGEGTRTGDFVLRPASSGSDTVLTVIAEGGTIKHNKLHVSETGVDHTVSGKPVSVTGTSAEALVQGWLDSAAKSEADLAVVLVDFSDSGSGSGFDGRQNSTGARPTFA